LTGLQVNLRGDKLKNLKFLNLKYYLVFDCFVNWPSVNQKKCDIFRLAKDDTSDVFNVGENEEEEKEKADDDDDNDTENDKLQQMKLIKTFTVSRKQFRSYILCLIWTKNTQSIHEIKNLDWIQTPKSSFYANLDKK